MLIILIFFHFVSPMLPLVVNQSVGNERRVIVYVVPGVAIFSELFSICFLPKWLVLVLGNTKLKF